MYFNQVNTFRTNGWKRQIRLKKKKMESGIIHTTNDNSIQSSLDVLRKEKEYGAKLRDALKINE